MEARRLGPVVGLGTWNTFDTDAGLAGEVVRAALEARVRVFDSSPMYRGAERSLGAALDGRRDGAVVATKIWARSLDEGREQFRRQLEWYGRVGRIGVTHYDSSAFGELAQALRTRRFNAIQLPYNPSERACERELLPLAAELGVPVIVMRPLGAGRLAAKTASREELEALGVETWPQALLKWALSDDRVDVVIPATKRPERARENAAAGEPPWLDAEQRALVERIAAR